LTAVNQEALFRTLTSQLFTARCCAKRGYTAVCRLSVCDVQVPWSHWLEYFKHNFTAE